MNLRFILSGFRTFFYSFKKKEIDEIMAQNEKQKGNLVVLGIHGSMMNYFNSFYPMALYFRDKKIKFIPIDYDYKKTPEEICKHIKDQITKFQNHKKILFIGHSFGGLMARYLVTKYLKDDKKYSIITVATPNHGVDIKHKNILDRFLFHFLGLMQPELKGSRLINYLEKNPLKKTKITNIIGGKDSLVLPEYARIGSKKPDIVIASEDHLSIIYSKALFCIINGLIKNIKNG